VGAIWEVYAPESLGGIAPIGVRRSIACLREGGRWIFEASGQPFEFERLESYSGARKADRFNEAMLTEYLLKFGLAAFSDNFYTIDSSSPAIVLRQVEPKDFSPSFTREEVISGKPWSRIVE